MKKITLEFESHLFSHFEGKYFSIHSIRDSVLNWEGGKPPTITVGSCFCWGTERKKKKRKGSSKPSYKGKMALNSFCLISSGMRLKGAPILRTSYRIMLESFSRETDWKEEELPFSYTT